MCMTWVSLFRLSRAITLFPDGDRAEGGELGVSRQGLRCEILFQFGDDDGGPIPPGWIGVVDVQLTSLSLLTSGPYRT